MKNQYEKKFKALEKAKADALEMAAQKNEKGKTKKDRKEQVKSYFRIISLFIACFLKMSLNKLHLS